MEKSFATIECLQAQNSRHRLTFLDCHSIYHKLSTLLLLYHACRHCWLCSLIQTPAECDRQKPRLSLVSSPFKINVTLKSAYFEHDDQTWTCIKHQNQSHIILEESDHCSDTVYYCTLLRRNQNYRGDVCYCKLPGISAHGTWNSLSHRLF